MFTPFDVVRLVHGIPDAGIAPGTEAVVLEVSDEPELHYEIEVVDDEGRTLYQAAVRPDQIEAI